MHCFTLHTLSHIPWVVIWAQKLNNNLDQSEIYLCIYSHPWRKPSLAATHKYVKQWLNVTVYLFQFTLRSYNQRYKICSKSLPINIDTAALQNIVLKKGEYKTVQFSHTRYNNRVRIVRCSLVVTIIRSVSGPLYSVWPGTILVRMCLLQLSLADFWTTSSDI